jgi:SPP1 gp7 family putative phage head morphogenesis protein
MREELRQARGRAIVRQSIAGEHALSQRLKLYFYEQRSEILRNMAKVEDQLTAHKALPSGAEGSGAVGKANSQGSEQLVQTLLGKRDWDAELRKKVRPILISIGGIGAKQILAELGKPAGKFSEHILESYLKTQAIILEQVNATTRQTLLDISAKLMDGLVAGTSVSDLMDQTRNEIRSAFNFTAETRRKTISRTESLRALNGGRMAQMAESGITKKEWLTVHDDNVRDSHEALDGTTVPMGESWRTMENGPIEYPGDPNAAPAETINCRCTVLPVIKSGE